MISSLPMSWGVFSGGVGVAGGRAYWLAVPLAETPIVRTVEGGTGQRRHKLAANHMSFHEDRLHGRAIGGMLSWLLSIPAFLCYNPDTPICLRCAEHHIVRRCEQC